MPKYAVVIPVNLPYMPGCNAMLNAVDYYGMTIDPYVMYWPTRKPTMEEDLTEEYLSAWSPKVQFTQIDKAAVWPEPRVHGWYMLWSDVWKALKLFDDGYDAVACWGADSCAVSDITEYFDLSVAMNRVVLATNEHGFHNFEKLSPSWPYPHGWSVPYADLPLIVPRSRRSVLDRMMTFQANPTNLTCKMDGLNYAIRDEGEDSVFEVPGELWVCNVPYRFKFVFGKNMSLYVEASSTRLRAFHRRYWDAGICRTYLDNDLSRYNKLLFNKVYNFFNRKCRVPWTSGIDIWDGSK